MSKVIRTSRIESVIFFLKEITANVSFFATNQAGKMNNLYYSGYVKGISTAIERLELAITYERLLPLPRYERDKQAMREYVEELRRLKENV